MSAIVCQLKSEQPLQVLNEGLKERLAAVNDAKRRLQEFGVQISSQDLRLGSKQRPLLRLARSNEQLREKLTQIMQVGAFLVGRFHGVDVGWTVEKAS